MSVSWRHTSLESLEVGATPLVRHLLHRLQLPELSERHLPPLPGRQPTLPSSVTLAILLSNLLLARQPLYALPAWAARRVPEHLGLRPDQAGGPARWACSTTTASGVPWTTCAGPTGPAC